MIVQCDQCNAKFRLDDSKVKEGGVKVRCSKCKNIFVVQTEAPAEEADFDSFLSGLMPPPPELAKQNIEETALTTTESPVNWLTDETGKQSGLESPTGEERVARGEFPEREEFDLSEFTLDEQTLSSGPAAASPEGAAGPAGKEFVFGELDLGEGEPSAKIPEDREGGAEKFPDEEFVFKDPSAPPIPEFELNIEGLEEFGKAEKDVTSGAAPYSGKDEDFFADSSTEFSFGSESEESKTVPLAEEEAKSPEQPSPIDFGAFEFGEAAVPEKGESVEQKPKSWALGEERSSEYGRISAPPLPEMQVADEELPPLSISSRRRGGSILPIAVTVASVLLLLVLAGGGYYVFREGPSAFDKLGVGFMAKWFGMGKKEEGGIAVRNMVGSFLNNNEVGEIFAINGEAVNNFDKPRASIQVKATLFGPKGEVLLQKTVYCGNVLSREQLSALPLAKLEAAMNNQFGDSLSNLALRPGKGIPFVIVLTNVPKDVVEFGVEVVGSTVASQ